MIIDCQFIVVATLANLSLIDVETLMTFELFNSYSILWHYYQILISFYIDEVEKYEWGGSKSENINGIKWELLKYLIKNKEITLLCK
jgi:hypothetical protein